MRKRTLSIAILLLAALPFASCGDNDPAPQAKIETVDELLERACELAGDCVDASQQEIDGCPAELRTELDAADLAVLEQFTMLEKSAQDLILDCFDALICDRFGDSLAFISDSDLMEPLAECALP